MLTKRIIPCLDVRDGRVVKGVKFQGLRDAGDPALLAQAYERQGADEIVLLDVSATPQGRGHQLDTVRRVRELLSIPLTIGGGVRQADDAGRLLDAGADKVSVNTAAVLRPELLSELALRFGRQCTVVAIDAASVHTRAQHQDHDEDHDRDHDQDQHQAQAPSPRWEVVIRSGKERLGLDAVAWATRAVELGAGEILLTSWDRDGTRSGYDLDLLQAVSRAVGVPVIASGGANHARHLIEALQAGADAVLAASIFHDGDYTVDQLKQTLLASGVEVRR